MADQDLDRPSHPIRANEVEEPVIAGYLEIGAIQEKILRRSELRVPAWS